MSLHFYVPPGIGDFSAMYSKLCNIDREMIIHSSNDSPNRLSPFLDILPNVKNGGYAAHEYWKPVQETLPPGTDLSLIPDGDYYLSINQWIEGGGKVADWIPGKTEYHYKMNLDGHRREAAAFMLNHLDLVTLPSIVGIYCSAYGNARHWGFWVYEEWRRFLQLVVDALPKDTQYIFIGAEYDVQIAEKLQAWMTSIGLDAYFTLGLFHIGTTIEVIRNLDYFFIFPSGLGFLADVVDTPNMMWFPKHLVGIANTFCDPENSESKQSYHVGYSEPELAFEQFKSAGLRFLEDRKCRVIHESCEKSQLK